MLLLVEIFGLVGIVIIITNAYIFESIRLWIIEKSDFFGIFISCSMCIGFWIGLGYSFINKDFNLIEKILFGGFISILAYLTDLILNLIEKIINGLWMSETEEDKKDTENKNDAR